jgi:hypothetical protein
MDYYQKYLKYKNKYLSLKKNHQIGGVYIPRTFFSNLLNEFKKIIPTTIITIDYDNTNGYVTINFNNRNSLLFYVEGNKLRLIQVIKRIDIPTTVFIEKIKEVFNNNNNDFIILTLGDTSKIIFNFDENVEISLSKMKILEKSYSWYESLGFTNDSLNLKREQINNFINQKLINNITDKTKLLKYREQIDIDNILIKDFMLFVKDKLKNTNTKDEILNIKNIIDELFNKLEENIGKINLDTNYIKKINESMISPSTHSTGLTPIRETKELINFPTTNLTSNTPRETYKVEVIRDLSGNKVYKCPYCKSVSGTWAVKYPDKTDYFSHNPNCPNQNKIPVEQ